MKCFYATLTIFCVFFSQNKTYAYQSNTEAYIENPKDTIIKVGDVIKLKGYLEVQGNPEGLYAELDEAEKINSLRFLGRYYYRVISMDSPKVKLLALPFKYKKTKEKVFFSRETYDNPVEEISYTYPSIKGKRKKIEGRNLSTTKDKVNTGSFFYRLCRKKGGRNVIYKVESTKDKTQDKTEKRTAYNLSHKEKLNQLKNRLNILKRERNSLDSILTRKKYVIDSLKPKKVYFDEKKVSIIDKINKNVKTLNNFDKLHKLVSQKGTLLQKQKDGDNIKKVDISIRENLKLLDAKNTYHKIVDSLKKEYKDKNEVDSLIVDNINKNFYTYFGTSAVNDTLKELRNDSCSINDSIHSIDETLSIEIDVYQKTLNKKKDKIKLINGLSRELGNMNEIPTISTLYNNKIYTVDSLEFCKVAIKENLLRKDAITIGVMVIPYKLKFESGNNADRFSFTSSLSLLPVVSVILTNRNHQFAWLNAVAGIGIGTVNLTPRDTLRTDDNNSERWLISGNSNIQIAQTLPSLVVTFGLVYEYKRIGIGLVGGFDFINNNNFYQWSGNASPWLALAFDYDLFKPSKKGQKLRNEVKYDQIK